MKRLVIALLFTGALHGQTVKNPPIAARIRAAPVSAVESTVTGSAGTVPSQAYVLCATLETGHYTVVRAAIDGSFETTLFAPAGTTVLIKVDPTGTLLVPALEQFVVIDHHFSELIGLAGTIVRVPDPPAEPGVVSFGTAGRQRSAQGFVSWSARGFIAPSEINPGAKVTIRVSVAAHITSAVTETPRVSAQFSLTPLSRADGRGALAQNIGASTVMTPTGLPVERTQWLMTSFQSSAGATLIPSGNNELTVDLDGSLIIPNDLPHGFYRPAMVLRLEGVPLEDPNQRVIDFLDSASRSGSAVLLPVIRVGNPDPPRLPWALLVNDVVEAMRGVTAAEDRGHFAMAPRIATSSERLVVPRDASYNLEPFAPTLAIGDRGSPPAPPLIPLRFPSGELRVTIHAPDGTVSALGPAPFTQPLFIGAASPNGFSSEGGGHISDPYRLTTGDGRFDVRFSQDGLHRIVAEGFVEDIYGNRWTSSGTYEIDVARTLVIDPFITIGTPFEVGDTLPIGAVTFPPLPVDVEARVRFAPQSDATRLIERVYRGRANRFGHARLKGFRFDEAGEYRVDLSAAGIDGKGRRWAATRTWGGVVAPKETAIVAHGRRGIDDQRENRQAWYFRTQTGLTFGRGHVQLPLHSGDIMWMEDLDATSPVITFHDVEGRFASSLSRYCCAGVNPARIQDGEIPLFSGNVEGLDVHLTAREPDIAGRTYRFVQRPLVRVREIVGEENVPAPYWRFNDRYGNQRGNGANGDLPNDFKFQFGGVVLGGNAIGATQYAIYGSLLVLVADSDPGGGTRVFPPFQTNGGGPIMKLKGAEIDAFFHPTAVRPGTILHRGEIASFAGNVAPPLAGGVEMLITSPSGRTRVISGRANRVGMFSAPSQDFAVDEEGVWKASVKVMFDGATSAGPLAAPFPTGGVLGSPDGAFNFYVVDRAAPQLDLPSMPDVVRPADGPLQFTVVPPPGLTDLQLTHTTTMPGFILEEGTRAALSYTYEASQLARDFPNLDLHDSDGRSGIDTITISLLLSGVDATRTRRHFARQVVIQGEELQIPEQHPRAADSRRRAVRH